MKEMTKLAWVRKMHGLSQSQLAKRSGVCINAIRNFEQRIRKLDSASGTTIYRLATALDVSMESLMEHED